MQKTNNNIARDTKEIVSVFKEDRLSVKITNMQFLDLIAMRNDQKTILGFLEKKLKYDDTKEKAFNRLYEELDAIKNNKDFQKIKPLYLDLILFNDRIELLVSEDNTLETIQEELLEILSRENIEVIEMESDILDLSLQKIVDTQIVEEEKYNSKVLQVVRDGFVYENNKVLRPQEVVVGKFIKPKKEDMVTDKVLKEGGVHGK